MRKCMRSTITIVFLQKHNYDPSDWPQQSVPNESHIGTLHFEASANGISNDTTYSAVDDQSDYVLHDILLVNCLFENHILAYSSATFSSNAFSRRISASSLKIERGQSPFALRGNERIRPFREGRTCPVRKRRWVQLAFAAFSRIRNLMPDS